MRTEIKEFKVILKKDYKFYLSDDTELVVNGTYKHLDLTLYKLKQKLPLNEIIHLKGVLAFKNTLFLNHDFVYKTKNDKFWQKVITIDDELTKMMYESLKQLHKKH